MVNGSFERFRVWFRSGFCECASARLKKNHLLGAEIFFGASLNNTPRFNNLLSQGNEGIMGVVHRAGY